MFRLRGDFIPFMALRSGTRNPLNLLLTYRNAEFLARLTELLQWK